MKKQQRVSASDLENQLAEFLAQNRIQAEAILALARASGVELPAVMAKASQRPTKAPVLEPEIIEETLPRIEFSKQGHLAIRWEDWTYPTVLQIQHAEWIMGHMEEMKAFIKEHRAKLQKAAEQTQGTIQTKLERAKERAAKASKLRSRKARAEEREARADS